MSALSRGRQGGAATQQVRAMPALQRDWLCAEDVACMTPSEQVYEAMGSWPEQTMAFEIPMTLPEGRYMFEVIVQDANGTQLLQGAYGVRNQARIRIKATRYGP